MLINNPLVRLLPVDILNIIKCKCMFHLNLFVSLTLKSPTRRVDNEVFKFKLMLNLVETVPAYKPVLSQHQDFLSCDPHPR